MSLPTLIPHLCCRNAMDAIEFYKKAFGGETMHVLPGPDGRMMHGCMNINGGTIFLADEFLEYGSKSPLALDGSPVTIHLQVPDCDAVFQQAVEAGAQVVMPLEDMFWGDRYGIVKDPFGHTWAIATTVKEVDPAELSELATKAMAEAPGGCNELKA